MVFSYTEQHWSAELFFFRGVCDQPIFDMCETETGNHSGENQHGVPEKAREEG